MKLNSSIKILIMGKDPTLLQKQAFGAIGDSLSRHLIYLEALKKVCSSAEIRIITYTPKSSSYEEKLSIGGLTVYGTNSKRRILFFIDLFCQTAKLLLSGWRPTVITTQESTEEGLVGLFFAKITSARFITQLHFDIFHKSWIEESRLNSAKKIISYFVMRRASKIRVVSSSLKRKVVEWIKCDESDVSVIPVSVSLKLKNEHEPFENIHQERIFSENAGKKVILYVGRVVKQKRLDRWLQVAKLVREKNNNVIFIIVGDGPDLERIRGLIATQKMSGYTYTFGAMPYEKLSKIYSLADIFLLMSDYEGFGRVIVESYLAKVPVVTTAVSGPEDIIINGETGYLVRKNIVNESASILIKMLEDEEGCQKMGLLGFAYVNKLFDKNALTNQLVDCWIN
jgi:glycosyltransferase involved in cell wall biosynthesis